MMVVAVHPGRLNIKFIIGETIFPIKLDIPDFITNDDINMKGKREGIRSETHILIPFDIPADTESGIINIVIHNIVIRMV